MKKNLSIFLALLVISSVVVAGVPDPAATCGVAVVKKGTTFKVIYKGVKSTDVKVSILDSHDNLVYSELIRRVDGFTRPYNFVGLKEGEYSIVVVDGDLRRIEKVQYGNGKISNVALLTSLVGSEGKYILMVPNKEHDVISVKVYDEKDRLVYNEQEVIAEDFAKVYDLRELNGKFYFEISDKEGNYKKIRY